MVHFSKGFKPCKKGYEVCSPNIWRKKPIMKKMRASLLDKGSSFDTL